MKYTSVKTGVTLMVGSLILASASVAEAGWGHLHGRYYGSSGYSSYGSSGYSSYGSSGYAASYGSSGYSSYGSSGYSSYGSSGHYGLGARLRAHMAAKRARHAARRASYGSSGYYSNYGSSGYSSSGYSSSGYSSSGYSSSGYSSSGYSSSGYSSSGSSGYSYRSGYRSSYYGARTRARYYSTPVRYGTAGYGSVYYGASKASTTPTASLVSNVANDEVYLTVAVPTGAKVFVNDKETTSTGAVRQFVSRGLQPDKSYKFEIRAEMPAADGQMMVETKSVVASGGKRENLQFAFDEYNKPIQTALILNVPEDAQVTLAGRDTKAIGEERTFRTSQLAPGQVWDDYRVQVRLGDQVKEQSVRLLAGDQLRLTFNFEDQNTERLASR